MPRPGLIIGLGGTGQWVLTWLKRDLLLSNNGQMPQNVKLLEIDTATTLEASTSSVNTTDRDKEVAVVGGVSLGKGEFIYVGGDSRPLAERVRDGKLKQIGSWYQAGKWLSSQAPAAFILDDGAGRLRQFGRMAIFKDILGQEAGSKIWRALHTAIEGVRSQTGEQRKLEIMVVGSFAGGTGSGMFIDVALILRMVAQKLNVHHVLRGFFALPSVFANAPGEEMKARSFAAWRELNRFMVVDSDFPMPLIEYVQDNNTFRIRPSQRLFDACYLVDGKRGGIPLAEEAKYGAFPMVAEAVSAILDEEAGTDYTQWIFTNLAPEYARRPETPMYSAVGAFTVQVPAYFVQEVSSHQFAQRLLQSILAPVHAPDKDGKLVESKAERHLALAAPDQNQEDRGFSGRKRSRRLLRESITYQNKTNRPTRLFGRIAELVELAIDESKRESVIDRLARAGGADAKAGAAADSWVSYFPDLGDDPTFASVRNAVIEHMNYNIVRSYGRREDEKEEEARPRFKGISEDVRTRFGGITSTGEEVEDFHGKCGDALKLCEDAQLKIFRQLARSYLLEILMGKTDNAIVARSGKLGYAWDYFDGLVNDLEQFLKLMDAVKHRREEIKPELRIVGLSEKARKYLDATAGKKIFWIFEDPRVKSSELGYLQAQQRQMELRREDLLHFYVIETAQAIKDVLSDVRDNIRHWIWHLSTGDNASSLPGMWNGVRESLEQVKDAHSYDTSIPKVQSIVADQAQDISEADLEQALSRWEWEAGFEGEAHKLKLQARIKPETPEQPIDELANPLLEVGPKLREETGRRNQAALLTLARRRFFGVAAKTTVAEAIKMLNPNPSEFAAKIADQSAEPLFDGDPEASPRTKSNLIRIKTSPNDPYFIGAAGLEGALRIIHSLDINIRDDKYGIQVVGSENPYKMTLVRTDDLYPFNHFSAWDACQLAYKAHMDDEGDPLDPVLMQNFAAEARAVEYERRFHKENQMYTPLHPRVVMLLEDPNALRQFMYLGMLGMVTEQEIRRTYRWELQWTKKSSVQTFWLTKGWNSDADHVVRPRPDIFNAIHGYVIMRVSQDPLRHDRIDFDYAQLLIDQEMKKLGTQSEIKLLQDNLDDAGFVGWLRSLAYDPDVPDRVSRQDYADLASVVELMLNDRIEELQEQVTRAETGRTGSGPFKTVRQNQTESPDQATQPAPEASPADSEEEEPPAMASSPFAPRT